jgi:hypothetical protein
MLARWRRPHGQPRVSPSPIPRSPSAASSPLIMMASLGPTSPSFASPSPHPLAPPRPLAATSSAGRACGAEFPWQARNNRARTSGSGFPFLSVYPTADETAGQARREWYAAEVSQRKEGGLMSLFRAHTTHHVDGAGRRCKPDALGARKVRVESRKWYGYVGGKKTPLCRNKAASLQLLARLRDQAESGVTGRARRQKERALVEHLGEFEAHLRAGRGGKGSRQPSPKWSVRQIRVGLANGCGRVK